MPVDLSIFPPERETALKRITRYSLFEVVLYRSNLWEHEHRVSWLVEELAPHLNADVEKARTLALVHDDAEILTGDVQAGHKAQMTNKELAALDRAEANAIEELSARYPKEVNGYSYRDLLIAALHKDSVEAQLVSYADKLDAYCETLHEILAGNVTLLTSLVFYSRFFGQVRTKLPLIADALEKTGPFSLTNPFIKSPPEGTQITPMSYARFSGKPHTRKSLAVPTEYFPFYDEWRHIVLVKGGVEGESWLIKRREFMPT